MPLCANLQPQTRLYVCEGETPGLFLGFLWAPTAGNLPIDDEPCGCYIILVSPPRPRFAREDACDFDYHAVSGRKTDA